MERHVAERNINDEEVQNKELNESIKSINEKHEQDQLSEKKFEELRENLFAV